MIGRFILFALLCAPALPAPLALPALSQGSDLDQFMARVLARRDDNWRKLQQYVLEEREQAELLGPGRVRLYGIVRDYTWYIRDGVFVRSPVKFDGVPIPDSERRQYEERWIRSELSRRKHRTERDAKRAQAGKGPALSAPSINEPRFVSGAYFLDFKFEPGNYYLAGKETLDGREVLKIDYLPSKMFDEDDESRESRERKKRSAKEQRTEDEIERKMDKTSQVTLWVDPATKQIVRYTFDNVWMDFLPAGWLVKVDDLRASMIMGQPFPGVWLPKNVSIHAGVTLALGPMEVQYKREFVNYRKADVSSKITVPKAPAAPKRDGGSR